MIYVVTNIKYDTDGEEVDNLPEELEINIPEGIIEDWDIFDYISDEISDITGFCHEGFSCEIKKDNNA